MRVQVSSMWQDLRGAIAAWRLLVLTPAVLCALQVLQWRAILQCAEGFRCPDRRPDWDRRRGNVGVWVSELVPAWWCVRIALTLQRLRLSA